MTFPIQLYVVFSVFRLAATRAESAPSILIQPVISPEVDYRCPLRGNNLDRAFHKIKSRWLLGIEVGDMFHKIEDLV